MPVEAIVLALLLLVFLVVSAFELIAMELAALGLLVGLYLSGLLDVGEALSGFANAAVITIGGLFVLNAGIERSGLISWMGARLARVAESSPRTAMGLLLAVTGIFSMFISNVATASLLMPATIAAAVRAKISPSRFLMPLAFISLAGGMVTVIGTTGNLIVQELSAAEGGPQFGFFSFAAIGLPIFGVVFLYLMTVGPLLIPRRRPAESGEGMHLRDYLVEVVVPEDSSLIGKSFAESGLLAGRGMHVLALSRGETRTLSPAGGIVLERGDRLIVQAGAEELGEASAAGELSTEAESDVKIADLEGEGVCYIEALITPRSSLAGHTAGRLRLRRRSGLSLLGVLRRGQPLRRRVNKIELRPADEILLQGSSEQAETLEKEGELIILNRVRAEEFDARATLVPVGIFALVVTLAATGILPLAMSVLAGVFALLLARTISLREAVGAVNLELLIIVACILPVGAALENSGAGTILESVFATLAEALGPRAMLAVLFVTTTLLTQVVQKASVVLGVPLAFAAASAMGLDAAPFLMAVAVAGGAAFLTPIAHPVNLLVYAPGNYHFKDFVLAGLPIFVICTLAVVFIIPQFWPFAAL